MQTSHPAPHWLDRLRRQLPLRILAPIAAILVLLWGFASLAEEIGEGETRAIDDRILLSLRTADPADPIGPPQLEDAARDITSLGSYTLLGLVTVAVAGYLAIRRDDDGRRHLGTAGLVLLSAAVGVLLPYALKLGFARPRPDLVPHEVRVVTYSFPSGHATGASLVWLTLAVLLVRVTKQRILQAYVLGVALVVALLVGLSRIYLGVHYPTDVLGGWALGAAWAIATWAISESIGSSSRSS
ncbi:MAG: phosphatase PAP2 family protein [Myxococcota bacterium]